MIPKTIHYCWFGKNPKPKKVKKCITSWREKCPDYQIIEWNEENFDCTSNKYYKWCYDNGKWAFLSDLARLEIIYKNGGIYLDTDVELIKPLDDVICHPAFFCFETEEYIATGLGFGAEQQSPIIKSMIQEYEVFDQEETLTPVNCPILNTRALKKLGLVQDGSMQMINQAVILPKEYFNPYEDNTGLLNLTDNTIGIHWYFKSALSASEILKSRITRPFHRIFGVDCFRWLKRRD